MDTRRLLFAALLSMGVLFLWQFLFPPPKPPLAPPVEAAAEPAPPADAHGGDTAFEAGDGASAEAGAEGASSAAVGTATSTAPLEPIEAASERAVVLENALVRAEFSNRGAQLVSLLVKEKTDENGQPIELVQPRPGPPYPFALVDASGAALELERELYVAEESSTPDGERVEFRYRGAAGSATKSFLLRADGRLDVVVESDRGGFGLMVGPGLGRRTAEQLSSRFNLRSAVWSAGGELETEASGGVDETLVLSGRSLDWVGIEDTYFLVALVPAAGVAEARIEPVLLAAGESEAEFAARPLPGEEELSGEDKKLPRDVRVVLAAADGRVELASYWGTKQYDRLRSMPWGLERTVHWGWLGVLARPMLASLQWIHAHVVANYGWSIVLLTSALKILLLPLSIASFKSMRKMQKINPRVQAIREKWRPKMRDKQGRYNADAQRQMNEEVMALYRAEGVNPAGGCLPILVQLPIFFAFYRLLATAVELWQAPWIGWIHNLAEPDPYYILPIVMGVSQLLQQKMTPAPPDAVQRRLMQAMPIVFTIFSLGFASGLVLYWFTNNLWSIGQQMIYNRIRDRQEEPEPATPGRGGKGRKS
ncbi:MAG TPA: membrane protein insertase YidC [Thermoanaerobaculia bacterium]|nr:membrane protein insertase YidC [Thermoanaerobaculia bacterium]